jgi:hypothetical protein
VFVAQEVWSRSHQGTTLQDHRHVYLQDWKARSRQGPLDRYRRASELFSDGQGQVLTVIDLYRKEARGYLSFRESRDSLSVFQMSNV